MGSDPSQSVVDENGEMWECDNLFLCDASVFPTASGANPMMTTLSTAQMVMTRLARRLQLEDCAVGATGAAGDTAKAMPKGKGAEQQQEQQQAEHAKGQEKRAAKREGAACRATARTRMRAKLVAVGMAALIAGGAAWAWSTWSAGGGGEQ